MPAETGEAVPVVAGGDVWVEIDGEVLLARSWFGEDVAVESSADALFPPHVKHNPAALAASGGD